MLLREEKLMQDRNKYRMSSGMETFSKTLYDVFNNGYLDVMALHALGKMFFITINLKVPYIEGNYI